MEVNNSNSLAGPNDVEVTHAHRAWHISLWGVWGMSGVGVRGLGA